MATSAQKIEQIEKGRFDTGFTRLYGKEELPAQRLRYCALLQDFAKEYGPERQVSLYSAPGRTEIGGNHTDHNNGVVLAAAVNLDIIAAASPNEENLLRVKSAGFDGADHVPLDALTPREDEMGHSSALIRGIAAGLTQRGGGVHGLDIYTTSAVLRGSGLSSSAAFEVCIGAVINGECNGGRFTPVELAQVGQYAENLYFGKPSGLMDQTASAVGGAVLIDFADPAAPVVQKRDFDLAGMGYALVITDTKGSHADLTPDYTAIRREMEAVAAHFDKKVLREVAEEWVLREIPALRANLGDRAVLRALHFFAECRRAPLLALAIEQRNMPHFLSLVKTGGHSSFEYNQNAYSLQNPAQQGVPLGLALSQRVLEGAGAWRLQGGGFAGTIQAFVPLPLLTEYTRLLGSAFGEDACHVLRVRDIGCGRLDAEG